MARLIRRRAVAPRPYPSSWDASSSMVANGRHVERGTEISVRDHDGKRRRVRFITYVKAPSGGWITVSEIDKTGAHVATRSFDPSKIEVVHTKKKLAPRPRKGRS